MGSPLNTRTKKVLVGAAVGMFAWELLAVFGQEEQLITDALVELALERPWIFLWIGAILGHLTLPRKPPPANADEWTERFVVSGLVFVVVWEVFLGFDWEVLLGFDAVGQVVLLNSRHLWAPFLVGYVMGSRLWPRGLQEPER